MKKRLRKKLRIGEFRELSFLLKGKLAEMDEATENAFFEKFFTLAEDCCLALEGTFCAGEFDLEVITGQIGLQNEARREAFLEGVKALPEITEFDATELA